jgi:predicted AAA+ superfamily ATPase
LELSHRLGETAIYLAADAPEAALPGWWERHWRKAAQSSRQNRSYVFLDEVSYLPNWPRILKAAFDQIYKEKLNVHLVLTGSSSLEVGSGTRETMAGRFERLVIRQWIPSDLVQAFKLTDEQAVEAYIRFGSFPGGINLLSDIPRWQTYIRDSIIDPAVGRDLLMLQSVRKPALLRQIFAVAVGHPGQILALNKIAGSLTDSGTLETIAHYLHVLEQSFLLAPIAKYSARAVRQRSSPPKLIILNNAFLSASGSEPPPTAKANPDLWGRWVENACLAYALTCGQNVYYWREEPLEIDAVITGSWGQWAVEIKTGTIIPRDLIGLSEFCQRNPEFQPLVIGNPEYADVPRKLGMEFISWKTFLQLGLKA